MKGAPMMDTSKKSGTNTNYMNSGMKTPDGKAVKPGAPGIFGNILKGAGKALKGAAKFGAFGPLGNIASSMIDKRNAKNNPPPQAALQTAATGVAANANTVAPPIDPDMQAGAVVPQPQDPNAMQDPNAAMNPMTKKKGAPKLKGNQHKLDMNKNGKIDAEDFKTLKKGPPKKYKY